MSFGLQLLWPVALGGLLSLLFTSVIARLATKLGLVDRPGAHKQHGRTVPLLGGLALVIAAALALAIQGIWPGDGLVAAMLLLLGIGTWDDIRPLGPGQKLAWQLLAAGVVVALETVPSLSGYTWLDGLIAAGWLVVLMNAVNLIDNADGVAIGTSAVSAAAFAALFWPVNPATTLLCLTFAGSLLGLLLFNAPPAKIFLGDGGSLPVGLCLGVIGLRAVGTSEPATGWVSAFAVLAVPVVDMVWVILRRLRARTPIYQGGRDHTAHLLIAKGYSPGLVTAAFCVVGALCGLVAVALD